MTFPNRFQSIWDTIGTMRSGMTILLYRTIAPRKFTVYPIVNNMEKEKKIQKYIKFFDNAPFVLNKKNNKASMISKSISTAAARESMWFTSPG